MRMTYEGSSTLHRPRASTTTTTVVSQAAQDRPSASRWCRCRPSTSLCPSKGKVMTRPSPAGSPSPRTTPSIQSLFIRRSVSLDGVTLKDEARKSILSTGCSARPTWATRRDLKMSREPRTLGLAQNSRVIFESLSSSWFRALNVEHPCFWEY